MPRRKIEKAKLPASLLKEIEVEPLNFPLPWQEDGDAVVKKQIASRNGKILTARLKKLDALMRYYQIQAGGADSWFELSLNLALEFVPGFQVVEKKTKGRKTLWTAEKLYLLWFDVRQLMDNGLSANSACQNLLKRQPWKELMKSMPHNTRNSKALYERYTQSKRSSLVKWMVNIEKNVSPAEVAKLLRELHELCSKA